MGCIDFEWNLWKNCKLGQRFNELSLLEWMGLTNASCVPEVRMRTMRTCVSEVQFSSQIKFEPKMPAKNGLHTNFLKSREITIALYCILLLDDVGSFFSWGPIDEMYPGNGPLSGNLDKLPVWVTCKHHWEIFEALSSFHVSVDPSVTTWLSHGDLFLFIVCFNLSLTPHILLSLTPHILFLLTYHWPPIYCFF